MDHTAGNTLSLPETIPPKLKLALQMLHDGSRLWQINAATGLAPDKVSIAARLNGVTRGMDKDLVRAVDMVKSQRRSARDVAMETGIAAHRITYAIRSSNQNRTFRQASPTEKEKWDGIFALRDHGATLAEIGKAYGVSRQRICQILQKRSSYKVADYE